MKPLNRLLALLIVLIPGAVIASANGGSGASASYERSKRAIVQAPGVPVEAACDAGDELVSGDCWAEETKPRAAKELATHLVSERSPQSAAWRCQTSHQDAQLVLRVVARARCVKKS